MPATVYSFRDTDLTKIYQDYKSSNITCSKGRLLFLASVNAVKTVAYTILSMLGLVFYCLSFGHYKNRFWEPTCDYAHLTFIFLQAFFSFRPTMEKLDKIYDRNGIVNALIKDYNRYHDSCGKSGCIPPQGPEKNYVYLSKNKVEWSLNILAADKTMQWLANCANKNEAVHAILFATESPHLTQGKGDEYRAQFIEASLNSGNLTFLENMSLSGHYEKVGCFSTNYFPAFKNMDARLKTGWESCQNESVRQRAMLYFAFHCFANNPMLQEAIKEYARQPATIAAVPVISNKVLNMPKEGYNFASFSPWKKDVQHLLCSV